MQVCCTLASMDDNSSHIESDVKHHSDGDGRRNCLIVKLAAEVSDLPEDMRRFEPFKLLPIWGSFIDAKQTNWWLDIYW